MFNKVHRGGFFMNEVKSPKKPLIYYYLAAILLVVLFNMLTVGLGEVVSCCVLGVALVRLIEATPRLRGLFAA